MPSSKCPQLSKESQVQALCKFEEVGANVAEEEEDNNWVGALFLHMLKRLPKLRKTTWQMNCSLTTPTADCDIESAAILTPP